MIVFLSFHTALFLNWFSIATGKLSKKCSQLFSDTQKYIFFTHMWGSAALRLGSFMLLGVGGGLADLGWIQTGPSGCLSSAPCVFHPLAEQLGTAFACNDRGTKEQMEKCKAPQGLAWELSTGTSASFYWPKQVTRPAQIQGNRFHLFSGSD